jgi:transcriptional regulator with XRE-family HTH domain
VDKSITSEKYRVFLRELRAARERSGITQVDLAQRLGETQSFISKCERGERRIDIVELRSFCSAIGVSLPSFVLDLDQKLSAEGRSRRKRR